MQKRYPADPERLADRTRLTDRTRGADRTRGELTQHWEGWARSDTLPRVTTAPASSASAPPASFSPSSGPAFVVVDALHADATLASVAAATQSASVVAPRPARVLEGTFADHRSVGLFRTANLDAALAACVSPALLVAPGTLGRQTVNAETLRPSASSTAGRLAVGHHALGDDAPPAEAERGLAYLLVHGYISNREVYAAYLRGLKESGLLDANGCQRLLMLGSTNVRHVVAGPMTPGEYFEILGFPSAEAIEAFWLSDLYAPLIELRQGAVDVFAAILSPG